MAVSWVDIGEAAVLQSGGRLDGEVEGFYVAAVLLEGELHAFEDRCTHDGESLTGAELETDSSTPCGVVICPRPGARFCLRTGAALTPPAYEPLKVFSARIRDGRVEIAAP